MNSHRVAAGTRLVLLAVAGREAWVEHDGVDVKVQKGSIRFSGFPLASLEDPEGAEVAPGAVLWEPAIVPRVEVGDVLVLADVTVFKELKKPMGAFTMDRPKTDSNAAPSAGCLERGFRDDPSEHQWCCKPHEVVEAEFSDQLALRRVRGELNPEVWPPVRNEDGFEVAPIGKPTSRDVPEPDTSAPTGVTIDELD